jgi:hypothetical protein
MMNRMPLLAGLLVVQLLLVGLFMLIGDDQPTATTLLDFEASAVTALDIEDGDGNRVSLSRTDAGWRIDDVPADADRITDVIEKLAGGSAGWPVATSESSQARFEVTADAFQRRLHFEGASAPLADLYIGTSPGFRRVHARREGDESVFSIDFGVHELPMDRADWLDKGLLQSAGITRVRFPDKQELISADDGSWELDGQAVDPATATDYVDRIQRLSVLGFFEPDGDGSLAEPVVLQVQDDQGLHQLTFRFDAENDQYVLTSDRMPGEFTVASYLVEQILIPASDLLPAPDADASASAAVDSESGGSEDP